MRESVFSRVLYYVLLCAQREVLFKMMCVAALSMTDVSALTMCVAALSMRARCVRVTKVSQNVTCDTCDTCDISPEHKDYFSVLR
jgi:hypothetical protein